eukprot:4125407-Alexandrium_andersonii.AAC.1
MDMHTPADRADCASPCAMIHVTDSCDSVACVCVRAWPTQRHLGHLRLPIPSTVACVSCMQHRVWVHYA